MRHFVLSIGVALSAILSVTDHALAAPRTGLVSAAKAKPILYAAAFSKGLKGWTRGSAANWKVSGGTVTFNGSQDELLAPFSSAKLHDFAVQATIKAVGAPLQTTSGYGVVVRAKSPKDGITGGSVTSDDPEYNMPLLIWGNTSVGGSPVKLKAGFNLFRIDVHGTDYSLSINGTHIVSFTITDMSAAGTYRRIGVWAAGQAIQVKTLKVMRLGVVTTLPALPPVQKVNLGTSDVPSGFQSLGSSFFTDEELAQLDNVSADSITSTGLLLSHQSSFGASPLPTSGPYAVFSYVYAYSTPETAAAGLSNDVSNLETNKGQNPNFAVNDAVEGIGNEAHAFSYGYTETNAGTTFTGTIEAIFFRRGAYEVTLFEDFVGGTVSADNMLAATTALAKSVDAKIQQAG